MDAGFAWTLLTIHRHASKCYSVIHSVIWVCVFVVQEWSSDGDLQNAFPISLQAGINTCLLRYLSTEMLISGANDLLVSSYGVLFYVCILYTSHKYDTKKKEKTKIINNLIQFTCTTQRCKK